jgi:hypothetical protein
MSFVGFVMVEMSFVMISYGFFMIEILIWLNLFCILVGFWETADG